MSIDVNKVQVWSDFVATGTTQARFNVPVDAKTDDLFLVFAGAGVDPNGTPFTGHAPIEISGAGGVWNQISAGSVEYDAAGGGTGLLTAAFWSKALTPGAEITLNCGGVDLALWTVSALRISGAADSPINVASAWAEGTDADPTTVTVASISPTVDNVLLVFFMAMPNANSSAGFGATTPAGFARVLLSPTAMAAYLVTSLIGIASANAGATGPVSSLAITKDPGVVAYNPRPLAIMVAVEQGGCIDGKCPFITTDAIASEPG